MMKISVCCWQRADGGDNALSHQSSHRNKQRGRHLPYLCPQSAGETDREGITESGSTAQCNATVKYIMSCTVHTLYCEQQGSMQSWIQANTNKGVSAPSCRVQLSEDDMK